MQLYSLDRCFVERSAPERWFQSQFQVVAWCVKDQVPLQHPCFCHKGFLQSMVGHLHNCWGDWPHACSVPPVKSCNFFLSGQSCYMGPTSHRDVNQSPGYNRTIRQPPATGTSRESASSIEVHLEMRHRRPAGRNAVGLTLQRDWFCCKKSAFSTSTLGTYGDLWGPMGTFGGPWGPIETYGDLWGP